MGNDGINTLHIRGAPNILFQIMNTSACIPVKDGEPDYFPMLREEYFAKARIRQHKPNYLTLTYNFRNEPCYDYLSELLQVYPACWMKNEFHSEEGLCGVWIGQMENNVPKIQEHSWRELSYEGIEYIGL